MTQPASPTLTQSLVAVAMGRQPADTVICNGRWVNVHSGEILPGTDVAIVAGRVAYVGPVSYTHLDVYKRQVSARSSGTRSNCPLARSVEWFRSFCWRSLGAASPRKREVWSMYSWLVYIHVPVSYTHLCSCPSLIAKSSGLSVGPTAAGRLSLL